MATDAKTGAYTAMLQSGRMECWPGEDSFNIKVGEIRIVLTKAQVEWLKFRLAEALGTMKGNVGGPVGYDAGAINAAIAVDKARG